MPNQPTYDKGTSFYTCPKASFTLEAAVVLPLLAGFFVTILFFFQIMNIQVRVEEALIFAGRKTAVESSVINSEIALRLSAEGYFRAAISGDETIRRYVKNGEWGILLINSDYSGDKVTLKADYWVEWPIGLFGGKTMHLWNQTVCQKWVGDSMDTKAEGDWVYVTKTGYAYHADKTCRVLDLTIHTTNLDDIDSIKGLNAQNYTACSRCVEENTSNCTIYYTDYGEYYHADVNCGAIKRTISKIKKEEIADRQPCKYCYKTKE